jgi:3-phenylpropionate/cinnamic acid dioxygenase small subunit
MEARAYDKDRAAPGGQLTREAAELFLYHEARLADEHRFDEWLALWDDGDLRYWIPANSDDADPARAISIAYDGRVELEDRVHRLKSRAAYAQKPRSRLRRVVSNVVVEAEEADRVQVAANFLLAELRKGHQDVFVGRFVFELRLRGEAVRIVAKKVLLINNDEFVDNLTFLL